MTQTHAPNDSWDNSWGSTNDTDSLRQKSQNFSLDQQPNGTEPEYDAEQYELTERNDPTLQNASYPPRTFSKEPVYKDGDIIDWVKEDESTRMHQHGLHSHRGLRGVLLPALDSARIWLIMILTGVSIGTIGGCLDVLVRWLGDVREGRCANGFFYNQVTCCASVNVAVGEVCTEWMSWSVYLGVSSIFGQSILQAIVYNALAVAFSSTAAFLVLVYAPYAFHTGIPEIKAILGGYVFDAFLTPWTLLIKSLGLALSVASGLSLGKEGPLVHVSCCMAHILSRFFNAAGQNQAQKRRILVAAAAAGISVAFGSPLGGVLFGLEELETFANESEVIWRAFVTSVIAAVSLQYIDPFRTAKLVLFKVADVYDNTWRAFELVPWMVLGVLGGTLGALLIRLNVAAAVYRHTNAIQHHPILEVVGATAVTAAFSYFIVFLRVQTSDLVANLFDECDPAKADFHGLCNPSALAHNVFLLLLTAGIKICLTAWTFGMMVPAGIFLPTIAIGACLGRAVGLITQGLHRAYPAAYVFSSCPPDPSVPCVSPGFYAVIGAAAMLGGVTRMTISLVVILFELTGALSHVLPIMIAVMVSKWVGDAFGKEGIYSSWIAIKGYPWLSSMEYHDAGESAKDYMVPVDKIVVVGAHGVSWAELDHTVNRYACYGYPVVGSDRRLLGFVTRQSLRDALDNLKYNHPGDYSSLSCTFLKQGGQPSMIILADILDSPPIQLRKEVPHELVVSMFQKMNLRYILFTQAGHLTGMITKSDVISLLIPKNLQPGVLAQEPPVETDILWEDEGPP